MEFHFPFIFLTLTFIIKSGRLNLQRLNKKEGVKMKKIIFALLAAALMLSSCTKPAEKAKGPSETKSTATEELITEDDALKIAVDHAKSSAPGAVAEYLSENNASDEECEMTARNGIPVFEVEFDIGLLNFRYQIDSQNGAIRQYERSINKKNTSDDESDTVDSQTGADFSNYITDENGCADLTLWYLDISADEVEDISTSLLEDFDNMWCVVSYKRGGEEHRAVVSTQNWFFVCSDTDIGYNGASENAISHIMANVSEEDGKDISNIILGNMGTIEAEAHGTADERIYNVEIDAGGYEYSYEFSAGTGEILSLECERDEDYTDPVGGFDAAQVSKTLEHASGDALIDYFLS